MANNKKTKIQTLIFNKKYYPTKRRVRDWIAANPEYKILKYKRNPIDDNPETYRVRQREPYYFKKSTFRTININKSGTIKAVVGKLK